MLSLSPAYVNNTDWAKQTRPKQQQTKAKEEPEDKLTMRDDVSNIKSAKERKWPKVVAAPITDFTTPLYASDYRL